MIKRRKFYEEFAYFLASGYWNEMIFFRKMIWKCEGLSKFKHEKWKFETISRCDKCDIDAIERKTVWG